MYKYGEERLSRRIAKSIVEERKNKSITTTTDLEEIVYACYPVKWRRGRTHPATKTFQALRIYLNGELSSIETVIPKLYDLLLPDARLVIISFHSLEDRIVKHLFKSMVKENGEGHILTKKPRVPTEEEKKDNPRARSAKIRVIEKSDQGVISGAKKSFSQKKPYR